MASAFAQVVNDLDSSGGEPLLSCEIGRLPDFTLHVTGNAAVK